ncbi:MAG TPA: NADH-quinone oxidoreductase subunit C [Candidatus Dormibacteraeota bacterium]|nr:NADH-quinone oxidoreductase subunit C [Candidatus Dormibacteraeota bacterium]
MSGLREIAEAMGLSAVPAAPGEVLVECTEAEFKDAVAGLAERGFLSDLFATATDDGHRLTAVFSTIGDPGWLRLQARLAGETYSAVTPAVHGASWYEREIAEVFGLIPHGHPALLPVRLHGGEPAKFGRRRRSRAGMESIEELNETAPIQGQGVFQLPLGPVRSGPQESAHFLFTSGGEDLVMVRPWLGYKHRAVEEMAIGRQADSALILAERLAGTSTFANGIAFAQAVERAGEVEVSDEARRARALLAEMERLHSHFASLAKVADSTGLTVAAAQYNLLREEALQGCAALTGHRYLRGILAIGGLAGPVAAGGLRELSGSVVRWRRRSRGLEELLEGTATFVDRLETTAILASEYAHEHYLVGPVGRASGVDRDSRRDHPYAGYPELEFQVLAKSQGDALARVRVLLFEVGEALSLVEQLLCAEFVAGVAAQPSLKAGSALGWAEAPGGETLHLVDLDSSGRISRWRARPPAAVNWHVYSHACASGNNLTDYPVIEASFALSVAEFDR